MSARDPAESAAHDAATPWRTGGTDDHLIIDDEPLKAALRDLLTEIIDCGALEAFPELRAPVSAARAALAAAERREP